jgi:cytochrome c553
MGQLATIAVAAALIAGAVSVMLARGVTGSHKEQNMNRRRTSSLLGLRLSSLACGIGLALGFTLGLALLSPHAALAGGNAAEGKAQSLACQACHIPVSSTSGVPRLAGQREAYLAKQLKAFRAGDRKDDLMSAIAKQLSDADIENLSAFWSQEPVSSDVAALPATLPIRTSKLTMPKDFPKGFTLYHFELDAKAGTVARTYANAPALAAARAGKPLPDGSMLIVANYSAKLDAAKQPVREADGSPAVDQLQSYAAMGSQAGWGKAIPELLRNDNWAYGMFTPEKAPRTEINQAVCLACHKPKASDSYVFTLAALQEKAGGRPATKPAKATSPPAAPAAAPGKPAK